MKELSIRGLVLAGVIGLAGLMLSGLGGVASGYSLSRLQDQPMSLDVDVFQQAKGTSCGEAVIAMVYNFVQPESPLTEQEVIEFAAAEGYYTEDRSPYTSPASMVKIAEHYGGDVSWGHVQSANQRFSLLIQKLRDGTPVVVDVLSDFSDPESEPHFIVVTGIAMDPNRENAVVISYNDPLTGTKETADYAGSQGVWNAWQTNTDPGGSGWWMTISTP